MQVGDAEGAPVAAVDWGLGVSWGDGEGILEGARTDDEDEFVGREEGVVVGDWVGHWVRHLWIGLSKDGFLTREWNVRPDAGLWKMLKVRQAARLAGGF